MSFACGVADVDTIRRGVLAPGRIARSIAADLMVVPDAELVANGSRSLERAGAFVAEFGGHPDRIRWTSYAAPEGVSEWSEPDEPVIGRGYGHEILEVHRCLRAGALTSEIVPPSRTISVMQQMDAIRARIAIPHDG